MITLLFIITDWLIWQTRQEIEAHYTPHKKINKILPLIDQYLNLNAKSSVS